MHRIILALLMSVCVASAANAEIMAKAMLGVACTSQENASVNIQMNGTEKEAGIIKAKIDSKIAEIKHVADESKIQTSMQNENYSISYLQQNTEAEYTYNANVSFVVKPPDKAIELLTLLQKKGYHGSMNYNSYRQPNCQEGQPPANAVEE